MNVAKKRKTMVLSPAQSQMFDQLVLQEEKISELYHIFSNQFPEHASFWKELSIAELRHANLLKKLKEATQKDQTIFDEGSITLITLNAYLDRLDEVVQKAKKGKFNLQTALSCAVDYESSLVEKRVFSFFDTPNEKFKEVLEALQSETEDHVEFIRNIQRSVSRISK